MKCFLFFISFIFLLVSCHKEIPTGESNKSEKQIFYENWNELEDETFGSFTIREDYMYSYYSGDYTPSDLTINETELELLYTRYIQDANKTYFSCNNTFIQLFGKYISIESENDSYKISISEFENNKSIYIPELLSLEILQLDNEKITTSSILKWNVDNKNNRGLLLTIYFEYSKQDENFVLPDNYDLVFDTSKIIEESGVYVFSEEDFKYFPKNAKLKISLTRICNGVVADLNSDKDFTIRANSLNSLDVYLKK